MAGTPQTRNLIDGEWVNADGGETVHVVNPANDEVVGVVPRVGEAEVRRAIGAAHDAWGEWRARPALERGALLHKFAAAMQRDTERLALLMTTEQGKPISESRGEIAYAASFIEWAAGEAPRMYGETIPAGSDAKRILVLRQPVGVSAIITPWNFPAAMITRKLGPALAAGCTAVIKPAEATPLSALAIGELAMEVGIPAGVVNIVTGEAKVIGDVMLDDERVRKLSFTGSTKVGQMLMEKASKHLLRLSMELGGHAPLIVFEDADIDHAVEASIANKFRNAGQTCICANRFYVHEKVREAYVGKLRASMAKLTVGIGTREDVQIGPLINDAAVEKVERHVEDAKAHGGKVSLGGSRVRIEGMADRFYAPTLIEGMNDEMLLSREETFGPVVPVRTFSDDDEAVAMANDSEFGLAAYFFTRDVGRLMRVAEQLEYGIVGANDGAPSTAQAPFGGMKHSGFGREGGKYVMDEYTEIKYVSVGL